MRIRRVSIVAARDELAAARVEIVADIVWAAKAFADPRPLQRDHAPSAGRGAA
jgi:hypothetical protein